LRKGAHIVVKLGGSLLGSPYLQSWLKALVESAGAAVVVPGGGPFADAVREAQARHAISDQAAHRMAILAMEQFAHLLQALEPRLALADSAAAIDAAARAGKTPVWLASRMTFAAADIPESWDMTSDSLALWLAGALGLSEVLLVKSARLPRSGTSASTLAAAGIVDPLLPHFLNNAKFECRYIAADRSQDFTRAMKAGRPAGKRIAPAG
jgi:5-(aminomethyl)-3-furanmethanol phosphate kinase